MAVAQCIVSLREARVRLVSTQLGVEAMLSFLEVASCRVVAVDGAFGSRGGVSEVAFTVRVSEGARPSIALLAETRVVNVGQLGTLWVNTRVVAGDFGTVRVPASVLFGALLIARTREGARRAAGGSLKIASLAEVFEAEVGELLVRGRDGLIGGNGVVLAYFDGRSLPLRRTALLLTGGTGGLWVANTWGTRVTML